MSSLLSESVPTASPFSRLQRSPRLCSSPRLQRFDIDLNLNPDLPKTWDRENPYAKFGSDRPSRLTAYKEHTYTLTHARSTASTCKIECVRS